MESYIYICVRAVFMGLPCSMSEQSPGIPPCQDRPGGMRLVVHDNAEGLEFLWQGARSAVCSPLLSSTGRIVSCNPFHSYHTECLGDPASHFPEGVPTTFHVPLSPLRSLYSPYPRERQRAEPRTSRFAWWAPHIFSYHVLPRYACPPHEVPPHPRCPFASD